MKKQIILDTNFLVYAVRFRIDLKKELDRILPFSYEPCILDSSIHELETLEKNPKTALPARIALHLSASMKILKSANKKVDDELAALASNNNIIATQDRALKSRIKKSPLVIIRQKSHLELQNYNEY